MPSGSIRLRSEQQGVSVRAQALRWEDERRRLVSSPGDVSSPADIVEFTRDDGSQVRGAGLEVDVRRKTIRFSGPVSGTLVTQAEADKSATPRLRWRSISKLTLPDRRHIPPGLRARNDYSIANGDQALQRFAPRYAIESLRRTA